MLMLNLMEEFEYSFNPTLKNEISVVEEIID